MIPVHIVSQVAFSRATRYALRSCGMMSRVVLNSTGLHQGRSLLCRSHSVASKMDFFYEDSSLLVLGTGGNEIKPTLLMKKSKFRYFFNCGEGTCRLLSMCNFRRGNQVLFLLTRASWDNIAGWQNLHLKYLNDKLVQSVTCMGPSNCKPILYDVLSKSLGRNTIKCVNEYKDENFSISSIQLGDQGDLAAYFCKRNDSTGSMDADKALSLGVPTKAFHELKNNGHYITSDGKVIQFSEVARPPTKGVAFVVLECPEERFIDAVCTNDLLQSTHFREENINLGAIFHITPLSVLETDEYCRWMSAFGTGVSHVLLHSSVCPAEDCWRFAFQFSLPFHVMNPEVYHFPHCKPTKENLIWSSLKMSRYLLERQVNIGYTGMGYVIKQGKIFSHDVSQRLLPIKNDLEETHKQAIECCADSIEAYQQSIYGKEQNIRDNFNFNICPPGMVVDSVDCMVTFLGTGASHPSKFRNQSIILLQTLTDGNILLDCGEGTVIQLQKCFGIQRASEIMGKIHTIFISHIHLDHWAGLPELLRQLYALNRSNNPVTVVGPNSLKEVLCAYQCLLSDVDFEFMDSIYITNNPLVQNNLYLKTIPVQHVQYSYGINVSRNRDWKIVYSGDTQPCVNLVNEARNADLLIHEGTYEESRDVAEVKRERHSFYGEAIRAAVECKAKFTAVSHFAEASTPLTKSPSPLVVPAIDFMSLKLSDIQRHRLDSVECAHVFNSIYNMFHSS